MFVSVVLVEYICYDSYGQVDRASSHKCKRAMVRRRVQRREAMMLFSNVLGIQFENKQTGMSLVSCGFSFWFRSLGRLKYRIGIKTRGWLAIAILGESLLLIVYPAYLYVGRN